MSHVYVYLDICHLQCCYYSYYYCTAYTLFRSPLMNFVVYKDNLFLFNIILFIGTCEIQKYTQLSG